MPPEIADSSSPATPRIVLASASPRRRELLALLGLPYEVVPSHYDEPTTLNAAVSLADFVTHLATEKARETATRCGAGWVLGADTEVALEPFGSPLGKPADAEDAKRMLRTLAGREHLVCTGVALIRVRDDGTLDAPLTDAVTTRVRFRDLTDDMIADYVATGEPLDKAGAYGAQGYAAPFIERFDGDFFNVVGLPLCAVGRLFERAGVAWWRFRRDLPPVSG